MELASIDELFAEYDEETRKLIKGLFLSYGGGCHFVKPVHDEWGKICTAFMQAVQSFAEAVKE